MYWLVDAFYLARDRSFVSNLDDVTTANIRFVKFMMS